MNSNSPETGRYGYAITGHGEYGIQMQREGKNTQAFLGQTVISELDEVFNPAEQTFAGPILQHELVYVHDSSGKVTDFTIGLYPQTRLTPGDGIWEDLTRQNLDEVMEFFSFIQDYAYGVTFTSGRGLRVAQMSDLETVFTMPFDRERGVYKNPRIGPNFQVQNMSENDPSLPLTIEYEVPNFPDNLPVRMLADIQVSLGHLQDAETQMKREIQQRQGQFDAKTLRDITRIRPYIRFESK